MNDPIIKGMATILWCLAYADHVENEKCRSLSGADLTEISPPIPPAAIHAAWRLAGKYEQANGFTIGALLTIAAEADGKRDGEGLERGDRYAERFGGCLAYAALGHGVSWFDDHAEFDLKSVHFDCDLEGEAVELCDALNCREWREQRDRKIVHRMIHGKDA